MNESYLENKKDLSAGKTQKKIPEINPFYEEIRRSYEEKDARAKEAMKRSSTWNNSRIFSVGILFFLMLSISSAHSFDYKERFTKTQHFNEDSVIVSKTVWVNYDNEKRFSTWDYRHGYSYRTTWDYFDRKIGRDSRNFERERDISYQKEFSDSGQKGVYYEYIPYLRKIEKRECYLSAPADKLFYIEC